MVESIHFFSWCVSIERRGSSLLYCPSCIFSQLALSSAIRWFGSIRLSWERRFINLNENIKWLNPESHQPSSKKIYLSDPSPRTGVITLSQQNSFHFFHFSYFFTAWLLIRMMGWIDNINKKTLLLPLTPLIHFYFGLMTLLTLLFLIIVYQKD